MNNVRVSLQTLLVHLCENPQDRKKQQISDLIDVYKSLCLLIDNPQESSISSAVRAVIGQYISLQHLAEIALMTVIAVAAALCHDFDVRRLTGESNGENVRYVNEMCGSRCMRMRMSFGIR